MPLPRLLALVVVREAVGCDTQKTVPSPPLKAAPGPYPSAHEMLSLRVPTRASRDLGMLLPWNVKPEWPGVTVERVVSTIDEVDGVTCLESQRVMLGPPQGVLDPARAREQVLRPRQVRPLPP